MNVVKRSAIGGGAAVGRGFKAHDLKRRQRATIESADPRYSYVLVLSSTILSLVNVWQVQPIWALRLRALMRDVVSPKSAGAAKGDLMKWTKSLFWLYTAGSALWATWIGLLLRDHGEDTVQVIALSFPLCLLAIAALVWAFRVLLS